MELTIQLEEAKKAIGISDFTSDNLLTIALTKPADFNHLPISHEQKKYFVNRCRRLAFLGDSLLDTILADFFFIIDENLTQKDFDDRRQQILSKESLTEFAIELGLPQYCSLGTNLHQKSPEQEPRIWAEMFEAVIAVIFIDCNRDFGKLSDWFLEKFILIDDDDDDETFISFEWEECAFGWQRDGF